MATVTTTAALIEVFASFQGEGPMVGQPTVFVRTAGCPLRCRYCDTTYSYEPGAEFEIRALSGRAVGQCDNPVDASGLIAAAAPILDGLRWLALTGGEPLLVPGFARELFATARSRGLATLLETAAVDAEAMAAVAPLCDHASIDYKLPSTLHGGADTRDRHEACIRLCVEAALEMSVKVVLTAGVGDAEYAGALRRLEPYRHSLTLVLQPVTPCLDEFAALPRDRLLRHAAAAIAAGFDVLVLPQVHKHLGLA